MRFELWRQWVRLAFLQPELGDYVLLAIYSLVAIGILVSYRRDFFNFTWRELALFVGLLAAPLLTERLLVIHFSRPSLLPPPNVPVEPSSPFTPLPGTLPIIAAATWLGTGPALLVGIVNGVLRAGTMNGSPTDAFHLAFLGFMAGYLLRQDYKGKLPLLLRQPLVAVPVTALFSKLLLLLSVFVHVSDSGLSGFDYAVTLMNAQLGPALLGSLIAAGIVQAIYQLFPRARPVRAARRTPPYSRSINRRLLFLFVPLIMIITFVLLYGVTATAIRQATLSAVEEMARDASSAAEGIPYFIHTGQGLLSEFADDPMLWHSEPITLETQLGNDLRTVAFFDQLMLFDTDGTPLAMYPPAPTGDPQLTAQESVLLQRVLERGATQISSAHSSPRGEAMLSFLTPVAPPDNLESAQEFRALIGRTRLDVNPIINRLLAGLQWTNAQGEGFVVDSENNIVAHPDLDMLLVKWEVNSERPRIATVLRGWAYESRNPRDNTRQLIYYLPAEGYPWAVVIRLPYKVVLGQAQQIATPLLILQLLLGGGLVIIIPLVTSWLTRPLKQLATAADRIAEGDLTQPVQIPGEDEVARVGEAFDDMRARLKDRMEDLSLLLEISQAVSATLELPQGMPFILEGALKATEAQVARIVLLSAGGEPQVVMSRGTPREGLGTLDRVFTVATKDRENPLIIENLERAKTLADPSTLSGGPIKAAVALPVHTKDQTPAVIWLGYGEVRQFDDAEVDLLSTLTSQTAVLVENARLFQAAEGGRRRLAAILSSTTDAVLVTDRDDCILLVNPAAERAFDVVAGEVSGQKIGQVGLAPALVDIFKAPSSPEKALTEEIPLPDGRTLYANASTIVSADGERIGRVAVMRDITYLKELDEMKSEFVATVSHDLRAPLTFMRGYATMLPTVGDMTDKQRDYVEKILRGVGQMSELIDDLLNLGRIEAGVGLEREPCHLGAVMVEAVDSMRARATAKGITLRMEPAESVAIVAGDAALLRQAITNLVDNAIKYTLSGGMVAVGLSKRDEKAIVHISDNGIGIAPDDQVRLFEKFYRIKRRDTPNVSGTGLGLAIVKSIIERHDGKVWVESELNEGSTFYVSLPLKRE